MKYLIFAIGALLAAGCSKSKSSNLMHSHPLVASIVNKWELVQDSSYAAIGSGTPKIDVYTGVAGDYWDFRSDGKVYIKEGEKLDTLGYQVPTDSTIIISTFGWTINGSGTTTSSMSLTILSAVIRSAKLLTPGGVFDRTLTLKQ